MCRCMCGPHSALGTRCKSRCVVCCTFPCRKFEKGRKLFCFVSCLIVSFRVHHFVVSCVSRTSSLCLALGICLRYVPLPPPMPACTYVTVLSHGFPPLPLISQDAQARETQPRVKIGLVSVWPGPPSYPPGCPTTTLSVLTSFSLFFGVLCS
jgi:hypothetical protein